MLLWTDWIRTALQELRVVLPATRVAIFVHARTSGVIIRDGEASVRGWRSVSP